MLETNYRLQEIDQVAQKIIGLLQYPICVFDAQMGCGKTTLIKAICKAKGISENMSSPTYGIVNEYNANNGEIIYHFDLYRLSTAQQLFDIGFDEYLQSGNICLIEWPQLAMDFMPKNYHSINIEIVDEETRKLRFE